MKDTLMRRSSRVLFALLKYREPRIKPPQQGAEIHDVTVINPCAARASHQSITTRGDRIVEIRPADGNDSTGPYSGCFVLPGLVDMHVHIPPHTRSLIFLLFLVHGVTTVRETGDADGTSIATREQLRGGKIPGPRLFTAGPVLDGNPPFLPTSWPLNTPEQARAAVDTLAAQGVDFIKVQHKLSPDVLAAIIRASVEKGLYVAGHVPIATPFEQAHIHDVQHLDGFSGYPQKGEKPIDYFRKAAHFPASWPDRYAKISAEQGLYHTPTVVTAYAIADAADARIRADPLVMQMPRMYRDALWDRRLMVNFNTFSDEELAVIRQGAQASLDLVRRLHAAGVRLHLGTDSVGLPGLVPGAALQRELCLFVQSGLAIEEAWFAGSRAAGLTLGIPGLGLIEPDAPADLAIFERDPTRDLDALGSLRAVVSQGRVYSAEFLKKAIERHRAAFEQPLYASFTTMFTRLMLKSFKTNAS